MEKLVLSGSPKTPEVNFDQSSGLISIKGRSIPENSIEFFQPINDWIDQYCLDPKDQTVLDVRLEYFNTSSSKCILDIFKKFEKLSGGGANVKVKWYFETDDEDMEEAGEDYRAIVDLPFEIVEVDQI